MMEVYQEAGYDRLDENHKQQRGERECKADWCEKKFRV